MADLIESIAERDCAALVAFVRTLAGAGGEAEDLAQEALLRAYSARARFDPARSLGAWLRAIAANVTVDFLRRKRRLRFLSLDEIHAEPAADRAMLAADSERLESEGRLVAALRAELAGLPELERRAFCLFYDEGRSIDDIARRLSAPNGTVKSWLHRARERLRARTGGLEEER